MIGKDACPDSVIEKRAFIDPRGDLRKPENPRGVFNLFGAKKLILCQLRDQNSKLWSISCSHQWYSVFMMKSTCITLCMNICDINLPWFPDWKFKFIKMKIFILVTFKFYLLHRMKKCVKQYQDSFTIIEKMLTSWNGRFQDHLPLYR